MPKGEPLYSMAAEKWKGDLHMKYIGRPMGMWVLFGKSFEGHLITGFGLDRDTAKMTAAKAKPRYKEIIAGLPEFEKSDQFKMNIVNCALLCAFVLGMPKRPNVKRLTAGMKPVLPPVASAP